MHRGSSTGGRAGCLTVGETPGCHARAGGDLTDPARGQLDMVFQFEHVVPRRTAAGEVGRATGVDVRGLKDRSGAGRRALADVGWNSLYLGNHDQPRVCQPLRVRRAEHRNESAMALATVLHLHRGTPFVYQGDELGMTQLPASPDSSSCVTSSR